ncbi:DUF167 domain-containing protein [bacterium]|nr:MAG: DUF167 domain-containing protein [bacterium]
MTIQVKVSAGAKQNKVEQIDETKFKVFTTKKPHKGQANDSVIEMLASFLHIAKSRLHIKRGLKTNKKVIEKTE